MGGARATLAAEALRGGARAPTGGVGAAGNEPEAARAAGGPEDDTGAAGNGAAVGNGASTTG